MDWVRRRIAHLTALVESFYRKVAGVPHRAITWVALRIFQATVWTARLIESGGAPQTWKYVILLFGVAVTVLGHGLFATHLAYRMRDLAPTYWATVLAAFLAACLVIWFDRTRDPKGWNDNRWWVAVVVGTSFVQLFMLPVTPPPLLLWTYTAIGGCLAAGVLQYASPWLFELTAWLLDRLREATRRYRTIQASAAFHASFTVTATATVGYPEDPAPDDGSATEVPQVEQAEGEGRGQAPAPGVDRGTIALLFLAIIAIFILVMAWAADRWSKRGASEKSPVNGQSHPG